MNASLPSIFDECFFMGPVCSSTRFLSALTHHRNILQAVDHFGHVKSFSNPAEAHKLLLDSSSTINHVINIHSPSFRMETNHKYTLSDTTLLQYEKNITAFLCRGTTFTNLHIEDLGMETIGTFFSEDVDSVKYWFVLSPDTSNISFIKDQFMIFESTPLAERSISKLYDIFASVVGGKKWIIKQIPGQTVYIPALFPHAVLTETSSACTLHSVVGSAFFFGSKYSTYRAWTGQFYKTSVR